MRFERIITGIVEELTPDKVRSVLEPLLRAAFFAITPPERFVAGWSMTIKTPRPGYLSDIAVYHESHSIFLSCWHLDARKGRRDVELLDYLAERLVEAFGGTLRRIPEDGQVAHRSA